MKSWTLSELRSWQQGDPAGELAIYGAGDLGKLALEALGRAGLRVDAFCDDSPLKDGAAWAGTPILSLEALAIRHPSCRVLIAHNYFSAVLPRLAAVGLAEVSDCSGIFQSADLAGVDVGVHALEIDRKIAWHHRECAKAAGGDHLTLKYVDVVITEACSMRCADCSNLMQYYAKPRHADFDELCEDLRRLLGAVDWIDEVRVLGGEPLVNKRFGEIVRVLSGYRNFRHLVVYTNATIVPGPAAMAALGDPRVTVNITDYGRLSRNLDAFTSALDAAGVAYLVKQPSWTDSGRIRPQSKSPAELDAQFERCCVNDILTLLHGRIYRCPFSANLTNLGVAAAGAGEVVWVGPDRLRLRKDLRELYGRKGHLTACSFCRGRDYATPKIPAAIQAARPLALPPIQTALKP
ncbi:MULTISPECIES: radical SAM protein [unclassified Phenylobacterium]|uniref:radical SAM protein n=1 Tax=unclassified Phenylobacterium TaxID=2640670 RepID=UPI00083B94E2|nr:MULTISPECIES: radical SAM protein [unclassified Phenylobacterium]